MKVSNPFLKELDTRLRKSAIKKVAVVAGVTAGLYFASANVLLSDDNWDVNKVHSSVVTQAETNFNKYQMPLESAITKEQGSDVNIGNVKNAFLEHYSNATETEQEVQEISERIKESTQRTRKNVAIISGIAGVQLSAMALGDYLKFKKLLKQTQALEEKIARIKELQSEQEQER